jgi:hypothetical protein
VEGATETLVVFVEDEALETWRLAAGTLDLVVSREDRDSLSLLTNASTDALLVVVVKSGA